MFLVNRRCRCSKSKKKVHRSNLLSTNYLKTFQLFTIIIITVMVTFRPCILNLVILLPALQKYFCTTGRVFWNQTIMLQLYEGCFIVSKRSWTLWQPLCYVHVYNFMAAVVLRTCIYLCGSHCVTYMYIPLWQPLCYVHVYTFISFWLPWLKCCSLSKTVQISMLRKNGFRCI